MNLFSLSGLLLFITALISTILAWSQAKSKLYIIWGLLNFAVAIWGFSVFKFASTLNQNEVFFWLRFGHLGVVFIPIFFLHFVLEFLEIKKTILIPVYILGVIFLGLNITDWLEITQVFIVNIRYVFNSFYVDSPPGLIYPYFVAFFWLLSVKAFYHCIKSLRKISGLKKMQLKYFILAMICLWAGGSSFLMVFGIDFYPWPHWFSFLYPIIIAYATLKYRLLDVKLILTWVSILGFVYLLVLGIPFLLWYKYHLAKEALWTMFILASGGPFAFNYFRKKVEDIFYEDNARSQETMAISQKLIHLDSVIDLAKIVIPEVLRINDISYGALYILGEDGKFYLAHAQGHDQVVKVLERDNFLVMALKMEKKILHYEDLAKEGKKVDLALSALGGKLAVPSFNDDKLSAIMILGAKSNNEPYNFRELTAFSFLVNQISFNIDYIEFVNAHTEYVRQEQDKMQKFFSDVSQILPRINDLPSLIVFSGELLYGCVKMQTLRLYLHEQDKFVVKLYKKQGKDYNLEDTNVQKECRDLDNEDALIRFFLQRNEPINYKEFKNWAKQLKTKDMQLVVEELAAQKAEVVLPLRVSEKLLGIFILGAKEDGQDYTPKEIERLMTHVNYIALAIHNAASSKAAITDVMTGLLHHGYFDLRFLEEVTRVLTSKGLGIGLIMFDIDNFKKFNDTHGHPLGNRAIIEVAQTLKESFHVSDLKVRYGGEEFVVVILREITLEDFRTIVESLPERIKNNPWLRDMQVTVSGAGVYFNPKDYGEELKEYKPEVIMALMVKTVDNGLYEAKEAGKNRMVFKAKLELKKISDELAKKEVKKNKKVLINDDHKQIRQFLRYHLEKAGWIVLEAETGQEAIKIIKETNLDLLVQDLGLTDMDGSDVIKFTKEIKPMIPIIVLSNYEQRRQGIMQLGINLFLAKTDNDYMNRLLSLVKEYALSGRFPILKEELKIIPEVLSQIINGDNKKFALAFHDLLGRVGFMVILSQTVLLDYNEQVVYDIADLCDGILDIQGLFINLRDQIKQKPEIYKLLEERLKIVEEFKDYALEFVKPIKVKLEEKEKSPEQKFQEIVNFLIPQKEDLLDKTNKIIKLLREMSDVL